METVQQYNIKVNNRGWCLCPWHNDSKPSMHINTTKNIAFCNPCGLGLDPIGFIMKYEGLTFQQVIQKIEGDEPPNLEIITRQKQASKDLQLVKRAIEVVEDYIFMMEEYKEYPYDSDEFYLYCHNKDYIKFIRDIMTTGEWENGKYIKNYKLPLQFIKNNVELFKTISRKEALTKSDKS